MCPRDYPENIDIRVIKYDDQILEDLTRNFSISESAIISLEDSFTLDSNERYISEIFFQNPSEDFNITGAVNFSEQTHVKFFKGGQIKKAIPFLERAHRSKPSESVIAEHLGDAYRQIELVEKAKQMYKRAVETASGKKKEEIRAKIMSIEKESKRNLASPKEFSPVELSY